MALRWLIAIPFGSDIYYHAGKQGSNRSVWVQRPNFARHFDTRNQAETAALFLVMEEPEIMEKLEVVEYGEASTRSSGMGDRKA
jgi:hypothetical protein